LLRALDEYVIGGIRTNLSFFRRILSDDAFSAARIDTGYLDRLLAPSQSSPGGESDDASSETAAVIGAALFESSRTAPATVTQPLASAWKSVARREGLRE
ncbi:MAG: acetyl-CoA carboxylase biotin carboxylase subunit, partial [Silvibacterium sp.]